MGRENRPVKPDEVKRIVDDWLAAHASGWSAHVEDQLAGRAVSLHHEASHGLVFDWNESGDDDPTDWILRALSNSAEVSIASAAPPLAHRDFVLGLRTLATVHSWDSRQMRSIASLLCEFGHLTDAETAWLAGWVGADAPKRVIDPRSE
jgi:hypothetical protein